MIQVILTVKTLLMMTVLKIYNACLSANTCYVRTKKDKGTDYILTWKSKWVYRSKYKPLDTTFLHGIKHFGYRMDIKFDKGHLAVKKTIIQPKLEMLILPMN